MNLLPPSFSPWSPKKPRSRQIVALVSGGVDSSTTAYLLKQDGWDVLGVTMKIPNACGATGGGCCGAAAAIVCNELDISHYFIDVREAFERFVIEPFRRAYAQGRTPNPCVECNRSLKFKLVWDFLRDTFGVDYLASGHYSRILGDGGWFRLAMAADESKDQSYFLHGIAADRLSKLVLPLGELTKDRVRSIAAGLGLSIADRPESMELCFANESNYRSALPDDSPPQPGQITDMQGNSIGQHDGISNFTIGQRRGLGVAAGKPLYVGRICPDDNTVALGSRDEISFSKVSAEGVNVLMAERLVVGSRLFGKIRSYGRPSPCRVVSSSPAAVTVEFDVPVFAPCPGQKLVLYDAEDNVVAGGTITIY